MRHLWSLLAGVVAAPLAWLFLATGQHRSQAVVAGWDAAGRFDTGRLVGPAIFLAVAGVLLGLVGTLRWSPAGSLAAGVLFVLPTGLMFNNPFTTLETFLRPADGAHRRFLGQDLQPWLPVENGTLLVLGVLLLMAVFSAQRWRSWPSQPTAVLPARPAPAATDDEVVAGITALGTTTLPPPATAGASPEPEAEATAERPAATPMTDEEILAAAAEFEGSETLPVEPPQQGRQRGAAEQAERSSGPNQEVQGEPPSESEPDDRR